MFAIFYDYMKIFAGKLANKKIKQMTAVRYILGDKKAKHVYRCRYIHRACISVERH